MNNTDPIPASFSRLGGLGAGMAALGGIGAIVGFAAVGQEQFLQSYLYAYVCWLGLTLGCLGFCLLHHMLRNRWSLPVLRLWEAGARLLPLLALLALPLLYAVWTHRLYPWADPQLVAKSAVMQRKAFYLNAPFFTARMVLYFAIWMFWSGVVNRSSVEEDRTGDTRQADLRANWSAPGFLILMLTITFAETDLVMSLSKEWFSTIFGLLFVDSMALSALAFVTLMYTLSEKAPAYRHAAQRPLLRDLGNMLLTMTMVWAYFNLSQFLIIWSGNLPEEASYYVTRLTGDLWYVGTFLVFAQFFGPFLALLATRTKRTPLFMLGVALWLLLVRMIDLWYIVKPMFPHVGLPFHFLDVALWLLVGGIWLVAYSTQVKRAALLPGHSSALQKEALEHA